MFGRTLILQTLQLEPDTCLQSTVDALLQATEQPEIVRWIEFPASLLLFLLVPGDSASGAVYILNRKRGTWYAIDFEDEQFGGYSVGQLEQLIQECGFLDLVEHPGLLGTDLQWSVEPGRPPEARV